MYIYDFFNDLDLLNKKRIPDLDRYPTKDVVYYGYIKKEDIPLNKLPIIEDGSNYLVYSSLENTKDLNYIMIDKELEYIKLLDNESPNYNKKDLIKRDSAFIESIWLFDELACLKVNPFFSADISIGYQALEIYFGLIETDVPLLHLFDNIPIKRDIFFAQFNYFVKKYIKHKLGFSSNKVTKQAIASYQNNLINALNKYNKTNQNFNEIFNITYKNNVEFDILIQQIHTLDSYYINQNIEESDNKI